MLRSPDHRRVVSKLKARSNSFDVSLLHATGNRQAALSGNGNNSSSAAAKFSFTSTMSNWYVKRHQPRSTDPLSAFKFDKSKMVKVVKDALGKTSPTKDTESKHKVVWDGTSGTKVDAQVYTRVYI